MATYDTDDLLRILRDKGNFSEFDGKKVTLTRDGKTLTGHLTWELGILTMFIEVMSPNGLKSTRSVVLYPVLTSGRIAGFGDTPYDITLDSDVVMSRRQALAIVATPMAFDRPDYLDILDIATSTEGMPDYVENIYADDDGISLNIGTGRDQWLDEYDLAGVLEAFIDSFGLGMTVNIERVTENGTQRTTVNFVDLNGAYHLDRSERRDDLNAYGAAQIIDRAWRNLGVVPRP